MKKELSSRQTKVFALLSSGGKFTVYDISLATHLCDPRSAIAAMRAKGVTISDEWIKTQTGVRFKRYFIKQK